MKLSDTLESILKLDYGLGETYESGRVDCFGMIHLFINKHYGVDLPKYHNGLTHKEISLNYFESKKEVIATLCEYFDQHLKIIPNPNLYKPGDILVCDEDSNATVGIACGGSVLVTAIPELGPFPVTLNDYKINRAYRCQVQ